MNRPSWIGQTLGGRYKIEEILGQGGMSAVYKATDPNLKRVVAIKLIHPHLSSDPRFLVRFEEEATAVAQLRHPNIVQVFDFNHDGDLYYMVQEFVPGETLQSRLQRQQKAGRRLPLDEVINYTVNICDATGYAHVRGMVHRDIKPANIMIDVHNQAILMDFGIVKILGGERHTATGAVIGTALYLSPELIRGEAPDPRADIYSLGVTLFEMASGRPPFEADSAMSLMMMHLNDPVPDLRQLRPEVPEALIAVIGKSLAKDRNQRYSSMQEFATGLKAVLSGQQATPVMGATAVGSSSSTEIDRPQPSPSSQATASPAWAPTLRIDGSASPDTAAGAAAVSSAGYMDSAPSNRTYTEPAMSSMPVYPAANSVGSGGYIPPVGLPMADQAPRKAPSPWLWIAGGIMILILAIGGIFIGRSLGKGDQPTEVAGPVINLTSTLMPTTPASSTPQPAATLMPTQTVLLSPTNTPTITASPTPTIPAGVPYVRINRISTDDQKRYIVEYETFEYTEKLPGQHIHFFFNNIPPDQAGNPGSGPWYLYGGPRPFDKFRTTDRPEEATMICALVANPNHSVQPDSGTCLQVPDVVIITMISDTSCLAGPGDPYPKVADLAAAQAARVQALSADESWWIVQNPGNSKVTCWVPMDSATFNGDISVLGVEQPPPLPTQSNLTATITGISVDSQGRYVVTYQTSGFTEQLPGTHLHFFFNTVSPDQVGVTGAGNRLMYGGPSPFTGYAVADRPAGATQMCVLVANPNHTIIPGSGNCFDLPG